MNSGVQPLNVEWVSEQWHGKLVLRGTADPQDAKRAAAAGVDGVVVSNHGGRQLDAVPSSVRAQESHPGMGSRREGAIQPCLGGSVLTMSGPTVPSPEEVMAAAGGTQAGWHSS
jgi:hypothetical protein